jgi:hypothetical protein
MSLQQRIVLTVLRMHLAKKMKKNYHKKSHHSDLFFERFFFNIALFISFFRSSMISLAIWNLAHRFIRRIRVAQFASAGCEGFVCAPARHCRACCQALSRLADPTSAFSATRTRPTCLLFSLLYIVLSRGKYFGSFILE